MIMNKKIYGVLVLIVALFVTGVTVNVYADTNNTTTVDCYSLNTKDKCNVYSKCRWMSGTCQEQYVASDPCNDNNIKKVLKIFGYVLMIAKFVIPLMIIGFGIMDLYKAVIDKDEKSLTKQIKKLGVRILAGLIVFFVPNMVYAVFSLSDTLNVVDTTDYQACANCIFDPTNENLCSITE